MPSLRIIPSLIHLSVLAVLLALISGKPIHAQSLAEDGFNPPFKAGTVEKVGVTNQGEILAMVPPLQAINHLARLNPDGDYDPAFSLPTSPNAPVRDLARQADGKIIAVAGNIQLRENGPRGSLCLDANGVLGSEYNPPNLFSTSLAGIPPHLGGGFETFSHSATLLELDRHGHIYLGGSNFDLPEGVTLGPGLEDYRPKIMRLVPDGTRDPNYFGGSPYNTRASNQSG